MQKQQSILQKEVRFLKSQQPGLSLYQTSQPSDMLFVCPPDMNVFSGIMPEQVRVCGKYLPSSPDGLIKVLTLAILQEAFSTSAQSHRLLKRVKQFAYDESILLAVKPIEEIPKEYRTSYNETGIRKMLVELFHLIEACEKENKVLIYLTKHPFAVCILQTLLVNVLKQGINNSEVTFDDVLISLSKSLGFALERLSQGIYKIGQRTYVGQDDRAIYKLCSSQDVGLESDHEEDSSFSGTEGSARTNPLDITNNPTSIRPSAFRYDISPNSGTPSKEEMYRSFPVDLLHDTTDKKVSGSIPTNNSEQSMNGLLKQISMGKLDKPFSSTTPELYFNDIPTKMIVTSHDIRPSSKVQVKMVNPEQGLYRPPNIKGFGVFRSPPRTTTATQPLIESRRIEQRQPHHLILGSPQNLKKFTKSFEALPIQRRVIPFQSKEPSMMDYSRSREGLEEMFLKSTAVKPQGWFDGSASKQLHRPTAISTSNQTNHTPKLYPPSSFAKTQPYSLQPSPSNHRYSPFANSYPIGAKLISNPARLPQPPPLDNRIYVSRIIMSQPISQSGHNRPPLHQPTQQGSHPYSRYDWTQ